MKCKECKYEILDAVGNTWCKLRQCVVSEVLIEKFGCKNYKAKQEK